MQELSFVLFQIQEARRHIEAGLIEGLRLALVLLDNAIELQMDRRIRSDAFLERLRESILNLEKQLPDDVLSADSLAGRDWSPLTSSEKRRIGRVFDAKVSYLSERQSYIDPGLVQALVHLHRYRNEAFHRARVRSDTILTATKILLELNCHLLLALPLGSMVWGRVDETWLQRQFGLRFSTGLMGGGSDLQRIVDSLRAGILESPQSVADLLADHLESRIEEFYDLLDYVAESTNLSDRAEVLRFTQYRVDANAGRVGLTRRDLDTYEPRRDLSDFEELRSRTSSIRRSEDRIGAFGSFSVLEEEFELIEADLIDFVREVDNWINAEIDRMRGK